MNEETGGETAGEAASSPSTSEKRRKERKMGGRPDTGKSHWTLCKDKGGGKEGKTENKGRVADNNFASLTEHSP